MIYISVDHGTTWDSLARPVYLGDNTPTIVDGSVEENGAVYVALLSFPNRIFARSLDTCKTWEFSEMVCKTPNRQILLPDGTLLWTTPRAAEVDSNGVPVNDRFMQSITRQDRFGGDQQFVLNEAILGIGGVTKVPRWTHRGLVLASASGLTYVSTDFGRTWNVDTAAKVDGRGTMWGFLGAPLTPTKFFCTIMEVDSLAILDYLHLYEVSSVVAQEDVDATTEAHVYDLVGRCLLIVRSEDLRAGLTVNQVVHARVGTGAYIVVVAGKADLLLLE